MSNKFKPVPAGPGADGRAGAERVGEDEPLTAGPDVILKLVREEGGDAEALTVTWDQSFEDVLRAVEERFGARYTFSYTHRFTKRGGGGDGQTGTVLLVVDDDMFDSMIEFALDQPGFTLDAQLVQTHWWPVDGKDNYLISSDSSEVRCATIVRMYGRLWSGPLLFLTVDHWYSPMEPVNLAMTAGVGVTLCAVLAAASYVVSELQMHAGSEAFVELDLHALGAMCAALSGPSFLMALFVRRNQQGTFIVLRLAVLGILPLPMALFCLGCACWRGEEANILGAMFWTVSSIVTVYLYARSNTRDVWARVCYRTCDPCAAKDAAAADEEEGLGQEDPAARNEAEAAEEVMEELDWDAEPKGKGRRALDKCVWCCSVAGRVVLLVVRQVTWRRVRFAVHTLAHFLKRLAEFVLLAVVFLSGASITYQNYALMTMDGRLPGLHLARNAAGKRSHMICAGSAPADARHVRPTVILEASEMFGQALAFGALRRRLASEGVVCTYDRAGFGWSEDGGADRSPERVAAELAYMLTNGSNSAPPAVVIAGNAQPLVPPFILAGHSAGSIYMRQFAMDFPELTAAVVAFDGLPTVGNGAAGEGAYVSDLQRFFGRSVLWAGVSFLQPLGVLYAFLPLLEGWLLPAAAQIRQGDTETAADLRVMQLNSFAAGSLAAMYHERRALVGNSGGAEGGRGVGAGGLARLRAFERARQHSVPLVVWARAEGCERALQWPLGCARMVNSSSASFTLGGEPASWYDVQLSLAAATSWQPSPKQRPIPPLRYCTVYPPQSPASAGAVQGAGEGGAGGGGGGGGSAEPGGNASRVPAQNDSNVTAGNASTRNVSGGSRRVRGGSATWQTERGVDMGGRRLSVSNGTGNVTAGGSGVGGSGANSSVVGSGANSSVTGNSTGSQNSESVLPSPPPAPSPASAAVPTEGTGNWMWPGEAGDTVILRGVNSSQELALLQGGDVAESMYEAVFVAWRLLGFD